jgi:phage tail sheath gpL-like
MINAQEHGQPLVITGTTTAENNQVVTVHINGKDYTGAASHGHFTTTVPAQQVGAFTDGQHLKVTANVTDHAGNHALPAHGAVGVDISINAKDDAATIDEDAQTAITGNVLR